MRKKIIIPAILSIAIGATCIVGFAFKGSHPSSEKKLALCSMDSGMGKPVFEKGGIQIYAFDKSPDFPEAKLEMTAPEKGSAQKSGKIHFGFTVNNYKLAEQTPGADNQHCANAKGGQHIHLILNNGPYWALYKPERDTDLVDGHYVALAFLSRSYHESVKHSDAYALTQFDVGAAKNEKTDLKAPMIFYSRPKGVYKGEAETKNILLDFYLVNTKISEKGNKVKATINGNEFIITKWIPYMMHGLPMGENTVKLALIDKNGKPVSGPFSTVERKFKLQ